MLLALSLPSAAQYALALTLHPINLYVSGYRVHTRTLTHHINKQAELVHRFLETYELEHLSMLWQLTEVNRLQVSIDPSLAFNFGQQP